MPTSVRSFCKINLGLAVGPLRSDGFHGLTTCYQTLRLHDVVTVSAHRHAQTAVRLSADHAGVPQSSTGDAERNTAWKMVTGALDRLGMSADVEVRIEKRLPVQGGLGAGSANAAAALLGLERELGVALDGAARLELAAEVGSDVPCFLVGGTVIGLGRGEEVYPLPDLPETWCVVAVPAVGVSTGRAFRALDERAADQKATAAAGFQQAGLTPGAGPDRLKQLSRSLASVWTPGGAENERSAEVSATTPELSFTGIASPHRSELKSGDPHPSAAFQDGRREVGDLAENPILALVRTGIENDFEEVVFSEHPSLRSTKRDLLGRGPGSAQAEYGGALYAALSGSGSALFGLYLTQAEAMAAQQRVQASGTRAFVTKTISRPKYWQTMFAGTREGFAE